MFFNPGQKYNTPQQLQQARQTVQGLYDGIGQAQGQGAWFDSLAKGVTADIMNRRIADGEQRNGIAPAPQQQSLYGSLMQHVNGQTPTDAQPPSTPQSGFPDAPQQGLSGLLGNLFRPDPSEGRTFGGGLY